MKTKILKSIIPAAALALTLNFSSCIGDLDVSPINPQQTMEFDNDAVFNKIYASFSLTGQSGPNGNGDIDDVDEGRSGMFRSQWYLNEFTADEAHWVWASLPSTYFLLLYRICDNRFEVMNRRLKYLLIICIVGIFTSAI